MQAISILEDIVFQPGREEALDAYLPPASAPTPAVLLIHGGGWRIGDKRDQRELNIANTLAAHGIAVFSINYLLIKTSADNSSPGKSSHRAWPTNFFDCKTALRFIRREHKHFNVDPSRIAVMGGSAGGHLSMLVGATAEIAQLNQGGLYTDQENSVSCIINLYGPHDLRTRHHGMFGDMPAEELAVQVVKASPITYFNEKTPPILIAHGTADKIIPVENSRALARELEKRGIEYWYVEIANAPHTFHLEPAQMDLRPVVLQFLNRHFGRGN